MGFVPYNGVKGPSLLSPHNVRIQQETCHLIQEETKDPTMLALWSWTSRFWDWGINVDVYTTQSVVICFSRASQLRHNPIMVVSFLLVEAIKQRLDVHPSVIQLLSQVLKDEWKSVRQREKLSEWCQSLGDVMNFHVFRERREQGWSTGCINRGGRAIDDSHSNFY